MSEQGRKYDSVLSSQHGGKHYKEKGIQPIEYANANELSFFQGNVVKYVTRYKDKKGVEDVKKAIHYLQMILEFEYDVFTDFAYSDEEDISQEELENYVKGFVPTEVLPIQSSPESLWYPPVKDGGNPWIEHLGNSCPVTRSTQVQILLREDREERISTIYIERARDCNWSSTGECWNIVAYRVVE